MDTLRTATTPTNLADLVEVGSAASYLHAALDINLAVAWKAILTLRAKETGRDYSPIVEIIPEWYVDSNIKGDDDN